MAHTATATITVNTNVAAVWQALTDPKLVKQYLFGTDMTAEWKKGGSVRYRGEWQGQPYEDVGTVLDIVPEQRIVMDYFSPMSGKADLPENHQIISYSIEPKDAGIVVTVTQDNNEDDAAAVRASKNWQSVLESFKKILES